MNDTDYVALVDTSREELRDRIALACRRFDRIARTADPSARPPGSRWTVQQVVAHVLTIANRYHELAQGREYRRADTAAGLAALNQTELEAVLAPVPELADQLNALHPEIDGYFDTLTDDRLTFPFHANGSVGGITGQTNWLGELLLHGEDIARAAKAPWTIDERDMLLVARGVMQVAPAFLRHSVVRDTNTSVALQVPGARPYLMHIHDGTIELRERRPDDRPDAVLRTPASTLTQLLYQRIGPLTAARRGLLVVGGRRPWRALKLQSYFEPA